LTRQSTNPVVVQKFGGTSVADPAAIRRLIEIARSARARDGRGPVLVVSAMSQVTNTLLAVTDEAGASRTEAALALVEQLRRRHLETARTLLADGTSQDGREPLAVLTAQIDQQFEELVSRDIGADARRDRGDG